MWTSSKRTFCLCLSIRSKLKSVHLPQLLPLCIYTLKLLWFLRAHWYLVVICFPGMTEPKVELWKCPESDFQTGNSQTCELADLKASKDNAEIASTSNSCENVDTETGVFDWGTGKNATHLLFLLRLFVLDFLCSKLFYVLCVLGTTQDKPTKSPKPGPVVRTLFI